MRERIQKTSRHLILLNRYYRITRFYSFLKQTLYKGGITILSFILLLGVVDYFFIDINAVLNNWVKVYSSNVIFSIFLLTETLLGLVPPELFIAWASKSTTPWLFLFFLATISYVAGILVYLIGSRLRMMNSVRNYLEEKAEKHIVNLRKWGGFFVFLGAVTPLPHSIVSLASGMIQFSFRQYLFFALFRYVRFAVYAFFIFQVFLVS